MSMVEQSLGQLARSIPGATQVFHEYQLDFCCGGKKSLAEAAAKGAPLATAWTGAAEVAEQAAQATAQLRPRVGRARPLAEKSIGTPDAGAVSMALCLRTVGGVLAGAHAIEE